MFRDHIITLQFLVSELSVTRNAVTVANPQDRTYPASAPPTTLTRRKKLDQNLVIKGFPMFAFSRMIRSGWTIRKRSVFDICLPKRIGQTMRKHPRWFLSVIYLGLLRSL